MAKTRYQNALVARRRLEIERRYLGNAPWCAPMGRRLGGGISRQLNRIKNLLSAFGKGVLASGWLNISSGRQRHRRLRSIAVVSRDGSSHQA